jgi:hypothetical protein
MTKQASYVAAMMIILPACSSSADPPQNDAGPSLFEATPGDAVQSPGNYVPAADRPYDGN